MTDAEKGKDTGLSILPAVTLAHARVQGCFSLQKDKSQDLWILD